MQAQLRQAFKLALSMVLFYWLALWMDWDLPKYGALAIVLVSLGTTGASLRKGAMRLVGTTVGLAIGMLGLALFAQDRWLMLAFLCAYLVLVAYCMPVSAGLAEAVARLASAQAGLSQARANLGAPGERNPQVEVAKVDLAQAELDLARTEVRAPTDGYVINLNVDPGDYASPGTPLLAFVDSASFHVQGFFRETQLRHIQPGDRAVVTLMSHRDEPLEGVVESIGWAINPPDIATTEGTSGLVPQVQPSFDWIRLAQRVPVRVKIVSAPEGVQLVSGTTASVVIEPE